MTSNQAADRKAQPFDRRWLALAVIPVAQLMTALDATIMNPAAPHAAESLHSPAELTAPTLTVEVLASRPAGDRTG
jgi:hypothetical protein